MKEGMKDGRKEGSDLSRIFQFKISHKIPSPAGPGNLSVLFPPHCQNDRRPGLRAEMCSPRNKQTELLGPPGPRSRQPQRSIPLGVSLSHAGTLCNSVERCPPPRLLTCTCRLPRSGVDGTQTGRRGLGRDCRQFLWTLPRPRKGAPLASLDS